eukprot:4703437-Amphidinium_carterae.1
MGVCTRADTRTSSAMVKTMPTELTRRASAELEASVCLGQPSGTLRRALFHEVRDIIHEASTRSDALPE